MKIDLHLHASERSSCSIASEEQHIRSAIEYGLDAIVFTDHEKLVPAGHLKELNEKYYPFKIFGGIEIRTIDYGEDVLVLGLQNPILESRQWAYAELHAFVRENGGYIALNHPYRYSNEVKTDIDRYVPDAIEIHSTNIGKCDEELIKTLAKRLNVNLISNSDAHNCLHTGIFYNEIFGYPQNDTELVTFLKKGLYNMKRDKRRIGIFNDKVLKREEFIKELIQKGKTAEDYHKLTGSWSGEYDRVAMGKSYEI